MCGTGTFGDSVLLRAVWQPQAEVSHPADALQHLLLCLPLACDAVMPPEIIFEAVGAGCV